VVVVGGGVVGCACAYALARENLSVTVVEQDRVGAHASGGSAGILSALPPTLGDSPYDRLGRASLALYPSYAARLRDETGIDVELQLEGNLYLFEEGETPRIPPSGSPNLQWVDAVQLHELEPQVGDRWAGALFYPHHGQVNVGRLTRALAEAAARRGATILEGVAVTGFIEKGGRGRGVHTTAGEILADRVVLAAGAWSGLLAPALGRPVPVAPVKGQMVWARTRPLALCRPVFGRGVYLVPKVELGIAIGATEEEAGFSETPTLGAALTLIEGAVAVCPVLRDAELSHVWASLRPGSADGYPILGPVPEQPQVVLATGHFKNGVMLSLITGELVAGWVLGRDPDLDVRPFSPDRFR
jgi:glycine oxidase